tara:strand:- start:508 stop:789 length:282 start_codon:yes stop_codon:yes gene_type:complete
MFVQKIILKQGLKALGKVVKRKIDEAKFQKMYDYTFKQNDLDLQIKQLQKTIAKQGKQLEQNDIDIAQLKAYSHPKREFVKCGECKCKIKEKK